MTSHQAVDYVVLPTGCLITDPDRCHFEVHVTLRGMDPDDRSWAVLAPRWGRLNRVTGKWAYEHVPSERRDTWIEEHSFTLDEALTVAGIVADEWDPNGEHYALWVDFRAGRSKHRNDPSKANRSRIEQSAEQ